ncbi:MAG: hypothetical protein FK734_10790 [Asgard group archaeon]|nr:hypothetical protein [Asgard group archaeon]
MKKIIVICISSILFGLLTIIGGRAILNNELIEISILIVCFIGWEIAIALFTYGPVIYYFYILDKPQAMKRKEKEEISFS